MSSSSNNPKEILRSFELTMPDGTRLQQTTDDLGYNALWFALSANTNFMRRFMEVYEPFNGRVSLNDLRQRLLGLCCDRRVATGEAAISLLVELAESCSKDWMN